MQPSSGQSPLPPSPSPLPPSPYQQTYSPENGLTFTPSAGVAPAAPSAAQPRRKKGPPQAIAAVFVIVFVVVALVFSGALDGLFGSGSSSSSPDVKVTSTSASHTCPAGGSPTETYLFTLVNSGSVNANAQIGFYLNGAQVTSGTYNAPAGASTPYTVTAYLASCPPSGSTYYLDLISVTAV